MKESIAQMRGQADVTITLKVYHHINADSIRRMHTEYRPLCIIGISF